MTVVKMLFECPQCGEQSCHVRQYESVHDYDCETGVDCYFDAVIFDCTSCGYTDCEVSLHD